MEIRLKTFRSIGYIILCAFIANCSKKEKTFFELYQEFKITNWATEKFVPQNRVLTNIEKKKLMILLNNDHIRYKDTLNKVFIKNDEFYDDPLLLFSSYTDFLLDTTLFNRQIEFEDSLKKINH